MTPDQRRAARTAVHAFGAVAMLGFLGWIIYRTDAPTGIGMGLVLILLIRELFHGIENVAARLKFSMGADGISGEVSRQENTDARPVE